MRLVSFLAVVGLTIAVLTRRSVKTLLRRRKATDSGCDHAGTWPCKATPPPDLGLDKTFVYRARLNTALLPGLLVRKSPCSLRSPPASGEHAPQLERVS